MFLYNQVMAHKDIYSLMFGAVIPNTNLETQIIKISTEDLIWGKDKTECYYNWGCLASDVNCYTLSNYNKTWSYSKEELIGYLKLCKAGD